MSRAAGTRSGWWTRRAITLHLALVVFVPLFLVLGFWQLSRALHGNDLSWAYTFEWPFFAAYAGWMWWKLVHEEVARCAAGQPGIGERPTMLGPQRSEAAAATGMGAAGGGVGQSDEATVAARLGWDPYDDEADPELAAYNRYLASLHKDARNAGGERTGQRGS